MFSVAGAISVPPIIFLSLRPCPRPTLFPYTTLFRSTASASRTRAPPARTPRGGPVAPSGTAARGRGRSRSEEHTSELQSQYDLVYRLLLGKKNYGQHQYLKH